MESLPITTKNKDMCEGGMEFRLVYGGPLKSNNKATAEDKQRIRQHFHAQLEHIWKTQYPMKDIYERTTIPTSDGVTGQLEQLASAYRVCNTNFLPLVSHRFGNICALDVLLLWYGKDRAILQNGGDIDNRIKTLVDALRRPNDSDEIGRTAPQTDTRGVFYCLMQDDSLVAELSVVADRLHEPPTQNYSHPENNVLAVIAVKTKRGNTADYWADFC